MQRTLLVLCSATNPGLPGYSTDTYRGLFEYSIHIKRSIDGYAWECEYEGRRGSPVDGKKFQLPTFQPTALCSSEILAS